MAQKWTDEQKAKLKDLHQQGKTYSQIAELLGGWCTISAVASQIKKMRDKLDRRDNTIEVDITALASAWKNPELTLSKIGELFGISTSHVRDVAAKNSDLFQPRVSRKKSAAKEQAPPKKQNQRTSSVWARRDQSEPAPSYYKPMEIDAYELERLPYAKPLYDLERGECKWPIGEDRPFRFCACKTTKVGTYCAYHAVKSIGNGTRSEREATKISVAE